MKTTIYLFPLICLSFLLACSKKANDTAKTSHTSEIELKEDSLDLSLKECKNISFGDDQLQVCLDSLSDSRCPMNANCVWAGTAIAWLSFTKNGQKYIVALATLPFDSYKQKMTMAGYTISLINVLPYPYVPSSGPIEPPTKAIIKITY